MADQSDHVKLYTLVMKDLVQDLLKHGADLPPSHSHTDVERLLGNLRRRIFLLNQEIAYLRPVSVGDHDPIYGADQRG